jgi:UDP:flavonoid glycosyltransferase YjiC (YdhE family)
VGAHLLRLAIEAFPLAEKRIPGLRMIAVTGPRLSPDAFAVPDGVELRGYVPDLSRHLAGCDLAVVHGGLTTAMELVAARRPFLYFPLAHHFEQQVHVPQRLAQYGAGRRMDYTATDRERLAEAMATEIDRPVDYRPVETDGAARAAEMLAELL